MNHVLTGLWRVRKSGFYMTTGDDQLRDWTKKLQSTYQSQTCTKIRSWSLFGGLLPNWSTTAFWFLVKPQHLRHMLRKWMRCTKNCNTYSQHRSTEKTQFFSTTPPTTHGTTNTSKVESPGLPSTILTWPLANQLPLLQTSQQLSSGKTLPQPAGGKKCFPRISWILKPGFLHYSLVQSLSRVWLFVTPWTAARQASLSTTNSRSPPKLMSIESVMPSSYLILCCPLLLLPSIFPSISIFSKISALHVSWPKYWRFSISPSNEYSGLISFRVD